MSLKENQNLCFVPILTLQFSCSLFSLLAREWVSLSIITIHATGVQLYGLDQYQRNRREHTHISRLPVILSPAYKDPIPQSTCQKDMFLSKLLLFSSTVQFLEWADIRSNLGDKTWKKWQHSIWCFCSSFDLNSHAIF